MAYRLVLPKRVAKGIEKIDSRYRPKIIVALNLIESNPYNGKKMSIGNNQWSYRVWPYRIIYEIRKKELVILVIRIGHRQGIYN